MLTPILDCIREAHDLRLVGVAAAFCVLGCWTSLSVFDRSRPTTGWGRATWLAVGALIIGTTVWTTHFVAMLAFDPGMPMSFDPALTGLSTLVGVVICGGGLALASCGGRLGAVGGAIVGLGVAAMHFTGMRALELPAQADWHWPLVGLALTVGIAATTAAAGWAFGRAGKGRRSVATGLLVLGIAGLHFTAMAAFRPEPTPLLPLPDARFSRDWLAVAVVLAGFLLIGFAGLAVLVDRRFEQRAVREAERMHRLANASFEGLIVVQHGRIVEINERFQQLVALPVGELQGASAAQVLPAALWAAIDGTPVGESREIELRRAEGGPLPVELLVGEIELDGAAARAVALRDLSERRRAEDRIRHLAHHDPLTGLCNRARFNEQLEVAIAAARERSGGLAVMCLDLDRFKDINDIYGHQTGDLALSRVAAVLRSALDPGDLCARLGGDEFAVVQQSGAQPEAAAKLAERLIAELRLSPTTGSIPVEIGTSIGIAILPQDGVSATELLAKADMALYRAKAEGRGVYRCFEEGMDTKLQARRALERDLRRAVQEEALTIHFQPQADAATGEVTGFEALVRWCDPVRGMVAPDEFIPVAESVGLIRQIGEFVLRRACEEAVRWPLPLRLGVNLSPVQFDRYDLVGLVESVLMETGLDPDRLELEITEGVLLSQTERTIQTLKALKALGVRVAMDDFGTGYSSLSYLHRFPFDRIKIDRSFVASLQERRESLSIIKAVITMGHSLDIDIVAEGVENEEQLALLRLLRCQEIQGYLLSRPIAQAELSSFMSSLGERLPGGLPKPAWPAAGRPVPAPLARPARLAA